LVPEAPPLEDPLESLPERQRGPLLELGWIQLMEREGQTEIVRAASSARAELTRKLEKQGVDIEGLLQKYDSFLAEITRRGETVVDALDQQLIRMPGYALPLEFSGTGVKEFLLVPYVGACIHVPPPPPNQIVYVRVDKTFTPTDQYTPVWVTGRLAAKPMQKSVMLVDGRSNVHMGYELDGAKVEPYTK
jgi:hypothetical protein